MAEDIDYKDRAGARQIMRQMVQVTWERARTMDSVESWWNLKMQLNGMMTCLIWTQALGETCDPAYKEADKFNRRIYRIADDRWETLRR